jgi:hypothetical protein
MFGSKEDDIKEYLIKKDYEVKEYLKKNGDWYYFKVRNFWSGAHIKKVKDGLFGFSVEKV